MLFPRFSASTRASPPPRQAEFFLKNAGILRNSTRAETSVEMTLQEQLAGEQESIAVLVELVDKLKRKTEESEREFEEFKKQGQEEYNRLCDQVMCLSSPGN
jgi:bacterioferritin (cytochrome b1)